MAIGAKGYWITTATITNPDLFAQYVEKVLPWLDSVDANVFAKDLHPLGKERTEEANFAVICEFPSKEAAIVAYESTEYQELSKIRSAATNNSTFTIMEGMDQAEKLKRAMGK
tara:strand:- start:2 stop:340 length:339 start_codon:yes stop_codon:yes gene_type:complete